MPSSQAAIRPPTTTQIGGSFIVPAVPFSSLSQTGKPQIPIFIVFMLRNTKF